MRRLSVALVLWAAMVGLVRPAVAAERALRIATLAPEGSAWMQQFHRWADRVAQRTDGRVRVKFYAGAVSGDERTMVHKMRQGDLDGAAVTAVGLSVIDSEMLLFELPFLLRNADELEFLRTQLDGELRHMLDARGFQLLTWGDVGPIYFFTRAPIHTHDDLKDLRLWAWVDDPIARAMFDLMGLSGVPLSLPDVRAAFEQGVINACYGSPLSLIALGWHGYVRYRIDTPLTWGIGAALLTRRAVEGLEPRDRAVVFEEARLLQTDISRTIRADNIRALASMEKAGLKPVVPSPELRHSFDASALAVRSKMEPGVYSHAFRARVEALLERRRATLSQPR